MRRSSLARLYNVMPININGTISKGKAIFLGSVSTRSARQTPILNKATKSLFTIGLFSFIVSIKIALLGIVVQFFVIMEPGR